MADDLRRMKNALARGGSVLFKGKKITSVKELPTAEELASEEGSAVLRARRVEAKTADKTTKAVVAKKKKPVVEEEEEDEE